MTTFELLIVLGMAMWILVALAGLFVLLSGVRLLRDAREVLGQVQGTVERMSTRLEPVLGNLEDASNRVRGIATQLKADADDAGRALRGAGEAVGRMAHLIEERVGEAAALAEVVQEEAEETFVSTASLLRGFRRGSRIAGVAQDVKRALDARKEDRGDDTSEEPDGGDREVD